MMMKKHHLEYFDKKIQKHYQMRMTLSCAKKMIS